MCMRFDSLAHDKPDIAGYGSSLYSCVINYSGGGWFGKTGSIPVDEHPAKNVHSFQLIVSVR